MTEWALVLFWTLVILAVAQAVTALPFIWVLRRAPTARSNTEFCPKTAVVLCLRGTDPFLAACLDAILRQDYPCYDLHIVVDSADDPAWATIERMRRPDNGPNVHIRPLTARRQTCSLKCSSLLQALDELDASYEVIALLDADTVPHRTWLRELVAPLADDRIGATTGNRWYMPESVSWASLVRWLWNTAAVVHMYYWQIPWGGTLALRMSAVRQSDLPDRLARAFCEDTMLYTLLRRLGYDTAFVPSLIMVNREGCSLGGFYRWVRRQLLNTRLYHPAWALVMGHGLVVSVLQCLAIGSLVVATGTGYGDAAKWLLAGMGSYWSIMAGTAAAIEATVRRIPAARGEPTAWFRAVDVPRAAGALFLTQAVYSVALVSSLLLRTVEWRGIRYRVKGPDRVRMIEYRPCAGGLPRQHARQSL